MTAETTSRIREDDGSDEMYAFYAEQFADDEPYCDYCERTGHSFSACPQRDDEAYEEECDHELAEVYTAAGEAWIVCQNECGYEERAR